MTYMPDVPQRQKRLPRSHFGHLTPLQVSQVRKRLRPLTPDTAEWQAACRGLHRTYGVDYMLIDRIGRDDRGPL
jgi:hypothetical protein